MNEKNTDHPQLLEPMSHSLIEAATGPRIVALAAIVAVYAIAVIGPAYRRIETLSGGTRALDLLIAYTPERAYEMITAYGHHGRRYYTAVALTLDIAFPIALALLSSFILTYSFHRGFSGNSVLQRALLVPPAGMLADFLENFAIVTMLLSYPVELRPVALLASSFSTVKWTAVAAQAALVIIGLVAWLVRIRWRGTEQI